MADGIPRHTPPPSGFHRRPLGTGPEVQPHGAKDTAPVQLEAGDELPQPYVYRINRPAPYRAEGTFMISFGTNDTAPTPIIATPHQAALHHALETRLLHRYWGPLTVRVWAHRGPDEHYRAEVPTSAYVLELEDSDEDSVTAAEVEEKRLSSE
jgi:hypothetical protein